MQIDWLTVGAQIVNFLILIYLLKRFLYHPVMNAMAKREQRIADHLEEARRREQQAAQERDQYRDKNQAFEQQRQELVEQAKTESEQHRQQLLEEARRAVEQTRSQWQQEMEREWQNFYKTVSSQMAQAIVQGMRRALTDLADSELEGQMVQVFLRRLRSLDEHTCQQLRETAKDGEIQAHVITSFHLDETARSRIIHEVGQMMGVDDQAQVSFAQSADLLSGIVLNTGTLTVGWTVSDYLDDIEADLEKTLAYKPQSSASTKQHNKQHREARA